MRFTRPFEEGSIQGCVLDIGPQFFIIAFLEDGIRLNGFQCFRLSDIRNLHVPSEYAAFYDAALKKRGERIAKRSPVVVSSLRELLATANQAFPLVTIHREKVDPDVCHIGRVVDLSRKDHASLLEIGPDAVWDDKPETYRLSEITRVDFGGAYEEALHLVGGRPSIRKPRRR